MGGSVRDIEKTVKFFTSNNSLDMADVYNRLPSLREADVLFVDRDDTFRAAAALLARFNFEFGLCLVHAHCKLEQGEIMLARGNITQPEWEKSVSDQVFPERWLSNGQAYEFTTRPTKTPPLELFQELSNLSGNTYVLGLYHIGRDESKESLRMVEHTKGRQNILGPSDEHPNNTGLREFDAAWDMKNADPVHSSCQPTTVCVEDDDVHVGECRRTEITCSRCNQQSTIGRGSAETMYG